MATGETIEATARRAWIEQGPNMIEHVALGFMSEGLAQNYTVWYPLPNTADPTVAEGDGRGEFLVDGEAIQRVLAVAQMEGHSALTRVLWHTHINTVEPSAEDIAEFPSWLAHVGMVYHVPSDKLTLYNESGIISPLNAASPSTLATPKE